MIIILVTIMDLGKLELENTLSLNDLNRNILKFNDLKIWL